MKSKVGKLDVDKLVPVSADLSKLSDVVKNYVVTEDVYNAKIKDIEDKIPDIINLATNTTLNPKINEVKNKIPSITNLVTNASLLLSSEIKRTSLMFRKHFTDFSANNMKKTQD